MSESQNETEIERRGFSQEGIGMLKTERRNLKLTHWGSSWYDPERFMPIQNGWSDIKPKGGLWTSPTYSLESWERWCIVEDFHTEALQHFFRLAFVGEVLTIRNVNDLNKLSWVKQVSIKYEYQRPRYIIDFESMASRGVDAIWLTAKGQWATRHSHPRNLYGWDCETVLVMNPACVKQIEMPPDAKITSAIIETYQKLR